MAETHQDNKRKAVVLRKQYIIKKHRPHSRDDARKAVQIIESLSDPKATKPSSEEQKTTNNQAEYEALIACLKLAKTLRIQDLKIYNDSQIVVKKTNGEYIAKDLVLAKYQALVQSYLALIPKTQVIQICREEKSEADTLSILVQNSSDLDCSVYFKELQRPSIESEEVMEIENSPNWMTPFINYLEKGELPEDKGKAQRLKAKAAKFFIEEGILYRRTFSSPILKCIGPGEAQYFLMEVHEGICGDHMSAKALAHKIIRQ
ncbi:uncharacterized protein LOC141690884 [Apium graveolens]|uniref:uncharacterized protein LOC141690884 n=1 Tax=Apium graveolens TaxID=4045 RepID=UPI003D7AEDE0